MTVFRAVSALLILVSLGGIAYDLRRRLGSWKAVRALLAHHAGNTGLVRRTEGQGARWRERFRKITYVLSGGLMGVLAVTGFFPVLFFGNHLSGFLLVIHVTVAPLFALALSALALLWAHRMSFDDADWRMMEELGRRQRPGHEALVTFCLKSGFWIILALSLPLMFTVILGLFPLFGTEGEALLIRLHGYSALLLMLAALAELYLTIITLDRSRTPIA